MSSMMIIVIGGIIVLLVLWKFLAATGENTRASGKSNRADGGGFRSVGIDVGKDCCRSASKIRGERFLINQAPPLPLAGCDITTCRCKYIHYADRRTDERREFPAPPAMLGDQRLESERRNQRDRRQD